MSSQYFGPAKKLVCALLVAMPSLSLSRQTCAGHSKSQYWHPAKVWQRIRHSFAFGT